MIPKSVAKAIPDKAIGPAWNVNPPIPTTKITEAINKLRFKLKSILLSIKIFNPLEAITRIG